MNLALESREVEGICGLSWSTLKASRPDWIRERKLNVILQMALDKLPELADVPSALDLVADPADRKVLELILIRQEMGRPLVAPPGVPAERVAALRAAFAATMKDADFLAEAQRLQLEIDPLGGEAIAKLLAGAYAAPREIVDRAAALVEPRRAQSSVESRHCAEADRPTKQSPRTRGLLRFARNDRNRPMPKRGKTAWQGRWRKRRRRRPGRARRRSARRAATRTSSTR